MYLSRVQMIIDGTAEMKIFGEQPLDRFAILVDVGLQGSLRNLQRTQLHEASWDLRV
jgi:hypothetical protein